MKRAISLCSCLLMFAVPLAAADETGPITWVALEKTESGMSRQLINASITVDGPMYDEKLADGTLLSWGIAIPINHHLGADWNYFLWATMSDWGKVQDLQGGFEDMFASRTPEEMQKNQQLYDEATVDGAHHDWIVRHHVHEVTAPGEGPAPRYFHFSYWKAEFQAADKLIDFYKDQVAPIMAGHRADGAVSSYGITTQELHGDPDWTHITWYTVSDLEAIDTVGRSLEEGIDEDAIAEIMPMMDSDAHWDQVLLIVHLGGTESEME